MSGSDRKDISDLSPLQGHSITTSEERPNIATECTRVYTEYDVANPPLPAGPGWTRFICISDTHNRKFEVPDGDVLLHGGDLTAYGASNELRKAIDWLSSLMHSNKM